MLIPKLFTCIKEYNREQFVKDFIAGIIVAVIALPLSIALAISSGVSPEKGLYTAIIGGFIVSFLGGSRVQIGGPTGAFIIIVYGIIQKYGVVGLTVSTIIAGIFLILMGLFRFGKVLKYIPYPIITGFTSGIAVSIFSTQIADFFGLKIKSIPAEFIPKWISYISHANTTNIQTLLIGLLTLGIIVVWPKINKKIPGTLIALVIATVVTMALKLDVATIGSRYGNIPSTFPKIVVHGININMIKELIMPSITIAILGAIESLLSAAVADEMIGGNHRSNMELVAQGFANIFSGLFGGIPVTGAIARTAANVKNGGRTPITGMVHAIVLLFIMLLFMPYVKLVPMTSLAAILMMVSYNMGDWAAFKSLSKAPKSDAAVFLITFVLTLVLDLVVAIGIGVAVATFLFMKRMADYSEVKSLMNDEEDEDCSKLLEGVKSPKEVSFYEITGPFFFAATDKFASVTRNLNANCSVLIIKMSKVPTIDATGHHEFESLYSACKQNGTELIILKSKEQVLRVLGSYGFVDKLGKENFCSNIEEAVARTNNLIDYKNKNMVA